MNQRNVFPWVTALAALLVAGLGVAQPGAAQQSQSPFSTVESLTGQKVVVFFRDLPNSGGRGIIQIHGKVRAATEHGMWLEPERRFFENRKEEPYEGPLYLPWTSVNYAKVLR